MAKDPIKFPKPKSRRKPPVRSGGGDNMGGGSNGDTNWKGLALFLALIGVIILATYFNMHQGPAQEDKTTEQFNSLLSEKKVIAPISFEREPATHLAYL